MSIAKLNTLNIATAHPSGSKIRRNYRGEDPTAQRALNNLEPDRRAPAPTVKGAKPYGGAAITAEARTCAKSFGMHPYQVRQMLEKVAAQPFSTTTFQGHLVTTQNRNGITTIIAIL